MPLRHYPQGWWSSAYNARHIAVVPAETKTKLERLKTILAGYGSALVTFSGGVDSTFLLKVATDTLGENCHAVTCVSVTMASSEREDAVKLGVELGLDSDEVPGPFEVVDSGA